LTWLKEAVTLADRIGVIREGRLVEIVDMNLARPRRETDPAFTAEVQALRRLLGAAGR
jgi:ABC-type nitrate/sulfonate/bicarbonate transport system ATPase subunit